MNNYSTTHLFEFWEYIGLKGRFFTNETSLKYTDPNVRTWPSKVFGIDRNNIDFKELHLRMKNGDLPNSLGLIEDNWTENQLRLHNFKKTSVVKGMYFKLPQKQKPTDNFQTIHAVNSTPKAHEFAKIASQSFGYTIDPKTIIALLNCTTKIRLYLGSHKGTFANCGIVFLDKKKLSGIHMIGTIPEKRGLGLGRIMTQKLIYEAYNNQSDMVFLVASKAGERIYSKMGFITDGALHSYAINE